jgi:hypothetical protein
MLLIASDPELRQTLAHFLEQFTSEFVVAVGRVAEIERWPRGQVVVVEEVLFTPFWLTVGAAHIVVMTRHPASHGEDSRAITRVAIDGDWSALLTALEEVGVAVKS